MATGDRHPSEAWSAERCSRRSRRRQVRVHRHLRPIVRQRPCAMSTALISLWRERPRTAIRRPRLCLGMLSARKPGGLSVCQRRTRIWPPPAAESATIAPVWREYRVRQPHVGKVDKRLRGRCCRGRRRTAERTVECRDGDCQRQPCDHPQNCGSTGPVASMVRAAFGGSPAGVRRRSANHTS